MIHCELRRQGRSVFRVNGHAVPRSLLQEIGCFLVDVHGQSEHLSLLDRKYQLDFLDSYARTLDFRQSFAVKATQLGNAEQELKVLAREESESTRRAEFLRFQADEIGRAGLREGEEEELETERKIISSSEKLKELSYGAYQAIHGEVTSRTSPSALDRLSEALQMLKKVADSDPSTRQHLIFLEETLIGLQETARDIRSYSDGLEFDPQRLEEIEARLALIRDLKRKYGQTVAEIIGYKKKAESELEKLVHSSQRQSELSELCANLKREMGEIASQLSQSRSRSARKLVSEVQRELKDLGMSQVEFQVEISRSPSPEGIPLADGQNYAYSNDGIDTVEFTASTNPGEPLKPLARIASTGELSRFMLALKGALSQVDNIPVLVFDEIDIGVGGRSGEIIGKKLWFLARNRQVICVTHLPQIAAFADAHYSVQKIKSGTRTLSTLETLGEEQRARELATMLTGARYSDTALSSARELLEKAEYWKASAFPQG